MYLVTFHHCNVTYLFVCLFVCFPRCFTVLSSARASFLELSSVRSARAPGDSFPRRVARSLPSDSPPALTCFLCIKGSPSRLIMSTVSPDKRRKMESALNQLKKHTVVVADTGDFNGNRNALLFSAC